MQDLTNKILQDFMLIHNARS